MRVYVVNSPRLFLLSLSFLCSIHENFARRKRRYRAAQLFFDLTLRARARFLFARHIHAQARVTL